MMNNKLVIYKEKNFTKISNFFKRIFFREKNDILKDIEEKEIYNNQYKENFINSVRIRENEEEIRLKKLQLLYDNDEIDENDLSEEDIDKLIVLYKKETEELKADTERRKSHIKKMLKELKYL